MIKIKKVSSTILIILIVFQLLQFSGAELGEVYGSTKIIDFTKATDVNFFTITSYHGWTGQPQEGSSVVIKNGELEFSSTVTDLFPLAYLPLNNTKKIQFKLNTSHEGNGTWNWGSNFKIEFNDGTYITVHPNLGPRAAYEFYREGDGKDWSGPAYFVIRDIDGKLYNLGNGAGTVYVNYSIEIKNGNLIVTDSLGHNFERPIGNRKMVRIMFHPLYQWSCKIAKAYLDDIIITPENLVQSISIEGQSSIEKGNTINLRANILPVDVEDKNIIWTSSNLNIATIESVGSTAIVRGIKKGSVTITATAQDGSGVKGTKVITITSNSVSGEAKYITVDDIIKYETGYSDSENDPKYKEEYRYEHNPNLLNGVKLDNSMGYADYNGRWQDIPYAQFSKVGTYKIQYRVQDNPPTAENNNNFANYRYYSDSAESTIYVHRKPIALYSINGSTVTDNSYDLDHSVSHSSKGIAKWEWQYINSNGIANKYTATTKTDGINKVNSWLGTYGSGMQYKLILRVQDIEGVWSEPCIKAAGEISRPIADFVIEKNPMIYRTDTQKITDMSYDTNGLTLSYNWTVTKSGQTVLTSTAKDISTSLNQAINKLYPNVTGTYNISLKVTNSAGVQSDIVTKNFQVIVYNYAPMADFNLVSNESPAWSFPKVIGLHTLKYRPSNSFFHEEKTRFNVSVTDANSDNLGFIYNWKLERFAVKDISNISGAATNTYNYVSQYPFTNSFKGQGLPWGAYRITLNVTDKLPVPPYKSTDAKTITVTKNNYIVPELNVNGSYESKKSEIMVGDTIKLKAKTSKETENVSCTLNGTTYTLSKISVDSNFAYWEKNIIISDSITESGTYQLQFTGITTYGGNGKITREIRDTVSLNIVALKLINFRITDIVNHPDVKFPYTKDMLINKLIPYKAGYYVTFRVDSKGKPDNVTGRIDIGNNGSIDQVINMTKVVTGYSETWQGRFYTSTYLTPGTVIGVKLDCTKGAVTYDYNLKESWDGRSLIVDGSALQDGRVNLTN